MIGIIVLCELIALTTFARAFVSGLYKGTCSGLNGQTLPGRVSMQPHQPLQPLQVMVDSGFWESIRSDRSDDYELMLRRSIYKERWDECKGLISMVSSTQSTNLPSGRNMVYILAETCRRSNNVEQIIPLLEVLSENVDDFDCLEGDIVPVLNRFVKQREVALAQDIVNYLEDEGAPITAKSYSILISGWGRIGNEEMVDRSLQRVLEKGPHAEADTVLLNSAMDAYIKSSARGVQKAWLLLLFAIDDNAITDRFLPKKKRVGEDNTEFQRMARYAKIFTQAAGSTDMQTETDADTTTREDSKSKIAQGATSTNRMNSVNSVNSVNSMKSPNTRSFNTMLKGFRSQSFEACETALELMQLYGAAPDAITVNTVVSSCAKFGKYELAESILDAKREKDKDKVVGAWGVLQQACRKTEGLVEGVGCTPGVEAFSALISSYSTRGEDANAFRIFGLMQRAGLSPNRFTLTALVDACVNGKKFHRAREMLNNPDFAPSWLQPTPSTGSTGSLAVGGLSNADVAALHGAYIAGLSKLATQKFETAAALQTNPTRAGTSELMGYRIMGTAAEALDRLINVLQIEPDIVTINAFMQGLCAMKTPHIRAALSLLQVMLSSDVGVKPDDYTYSILFSALGKAGLVKTASQLLRAREAHSKKLEKQAPTHGRRKALDCAAVNSLLTAFLRGPDPMYAVQLFFHFYPPQMKSISPASPSSSTTEGEGVNADRKKNGKGNKEQEEKEEKEKKKKRKEEKAARQVKHADVKPDAVSFTILFVGITRHIFPDMQSSGDRFSFSPFENLDFGDFFWDADANEGEGEEQVEEVSVSQQFYLDLLALPVWREEKKTMDTVGAASAVGTALTESTESVFSSGDIDRTFHPHAQPSGKCSGVLGETIRGMSFLYDDGDGDGVGVEPMGEGDDAIKGLEALALAGAADSLSILKAGSTGIEKLSLDALVVHLFRIMRYEYDIAPDEIMISSLNRMFHTLQNNGGPISGPRAFGMGGAKKGAFSSSTARLVFEDLIVSGTEPRDVPAILSACKYPSYREQELLAASSQSLAKVRANVVSNRIFRKYGWNAMDSGWSPI